MAVPTLIVTPFAVNGDKSVVPQTDPNSFVNFNLGYTPDYEINLASGNLAAKAVERPIQNWLFNLCTSNIQAWQQSGIPPWYSTMPGGYAKNAVVGRINASSVTVPYRSLVDNNITDPLSAPASWEYMPFGHEALANVPMPTGGINGPTAQVISVATNFNTLGTGTFQTSSDAVAAASPNCPSVLGQTAVAGMLMSMHWVSGANNYDSQIYTDRTSQVFIRGATNGGWAAWRNLFAAPNVYVVGEMRMWSGAANSAAVLAAWGPGWHLCDGTAGTPDLRTKFIIGAGGTFANGATGGSLTKTITAANMPVHNHVVNINDPTHNHGMNQTPHGHSISDPGHNHVLNDPGHNHSVNDPGHVHGVGDPGHSHVLPNLGSVQAGGDNGGAQCPVNTGYSSGRPQQNPNASGTGIWIGTGYTGIGLNGSGTGTYNSAAVTSVSVVAQYANVSNQAAYTGITASSNNAGSGTALDVTPPYYALSMVMYTGA